MIINANALSIPLADKSVQMICTSPPYWGLRDYGTATWQGGDAECKHISFRKKDLSSGLRNDGRAHKGLYESEKATEITEYYRDICGKCGAIRIDNQLGLERTPEEYIANMVAVFRECWRVLRDDGTLWLNVGDSYAREGGKTQGCARHWDGRERDPGSDSVHARTLATDFGMKPKDLVGIPWRLAFALQADGWYLRSDIIWNKPNPMPESVTDRPTKSHEYLFLMAKSQRYYYDAEAIREEAIDNEDIFYKKLIKKPHKGQIGKDNVNDRRTTAGFQNATYNPAGRNRRTVWTIPTAPYKGAHFATFPPALVEPCIKAGTSERGCCPKCGKGWRRVVEKEKPPADVFTKRHAPEDGMIYSGSIHEGEWKGHGQKLQEWLNEHPAITAGWQPACLCFRTTSSIIVLINFIREWLNDDKELYDLWERNARKTIENGKNKILLEGMRAGSLEGSAAKSINRIQKGQHSTKLSRWQIFRWSIQLRKGKWSSNGERARICSRTSTDLGEGARINIRSRWNGNSSYQRKQIGQSYRKSNDVTEKEPSPVIDSQGGTETIARSRGGTSNAESAIETYLIPYSPVSCIVFDPFVGSGTTVKVAYDLGRRGVGLDLSLEYLDEQARKRIHNGHTARLF